MQMQSMSMSMRSIRRFYWFPIILALVIALVLLAGLVAMSWRNLGRLQPVQAHLESLEHIQEVGLGIEHSLVKSLRGVRISPQELADLRDQIERLRDLDGLGHPENASLLEAISARLAEQDASPSEILADALAQIRIVLMAEHDYQTQLLRQVRRSTAMEFRLAVSLAILLPLAALAGAILLRRRAAQVLGDIEGLLARLADHDWQPVPDEVLERTGPLARPALENFNRLAHRLQLLEEEHLQRQQRLEERVRDATEALLAQSRELARAERLAAVGAVAAGLAHELRNPLAGIQMACTKLQQRLRDDPEGPRLAAVLDELRRIDRLLTEQVEAARHEPEPLVPTSIGPLVDDLLALLRFQVPSGITLESRVDPALNCLLPAASLRQALLNLVLNAVQVQGELGRVEVEARREGEDLLIQVSDEGPGFPETMLRAGIRPFATGRAGGTGLGLSMVRRFVRDLDSELRLENRSPADGARVTLRLPCQSIRATREAEDVR